MVWFIFKLYVSEIIGADQTTLNKPTEAAVSRIYAISWKRQYIDLSKLAKLRWVDKLQVDDIAIIMGVGRTFLIKQLSLIKAYPNLVKHGPARRLLKLKEKRFVGKKIC